MTWWAYQQHNLERKDGRYVCLTCQQDWKGKPSSDCPGLPILSEIPPEYALWDNLFPAGLQLNEGQKPVALFTKWLKPLYILAECIPHDHKIDFDQGKYKFLERPEGFDIWRVNGLCVSVDYRDTWLVIKRKSSLSVGLYNWPLAVRQVAQTFAVAMDIQPVDDGTRMIADALRSRFFEQWKRLLATVVPKEICDLFRLMYASAQKDCGMLHDPFLYTDEYKHTRADLIKYHACRLFAANEFGLDDVAHWRERLSPTVPNKALNKTLDKLPVGVSYRQLTRLSTIQLENPVTNRLHLIAILCASDHHNWGLHEQTVVRATPEMIIEAGQRFGRTLKTRSKTRDIGDVMTSVLDFDQPYHGDFSGLAQLSQRWHAENPTHVDPQIDKDTPLAVPEKLDLVELESKGIKFLRTVDDCYREHELMDHCIHTYASKAAKGLCYLFHVDYQDKEGVSYIATIEVSPQYQIVQAKGPRNSKNAACDYGVITLKRAIHFDEGDIRNHYPMRLDGTPIYGIRP